jgi:hypothetical protein
MNEKHKTNLALRRLQREFAAAEKAAQEAARLEAQHICDRAEAHGTMAALVREAQRPKPVLVTEKPHGTTPRPFFCQRERNGLTFDFGKVPVFKTKQPFFRGKAVSTECPSLLNA